MTSIEELKKQINKIQETQKPDLLLNTKEDEIIRDFEKELISNQVKVSFEILVSEIIPEHAAKVFGGSKFSRSEYKLSWKLWEKESFRLVLTNVTHNNSKLVLKTPDSFKKDIVELIPVFAQKMRDELSRNG